MPRFRLGAPTRAMPDAKNFDDLRIDPIDRNIGRNHGQFLTPVAWAPPIWEGAEIIAGLDEPSDQSSRGHWIVVRDIVRDLRKVSKRGLGPIEPSHA